MAKQSTFSVNHVVQITIDGKGERGSKLVSDLLDFLFKNRIYYAVKGGHAGGGSYSGFFSTENANKIQAWLKQRGVKWKL